MRDRERGGAPPPDRRCGRHAQATPNWRKSSYSGQGGNCLEVADTAGFTPVRDSKRPDGPALVLRTGAWAAFISGVKSGGVPPAV
ncbi:DUF397 domain-containing protein [Streptomyces roseoverticillatus]|uniref:DUF397 domain-containing protein n=1 Tax=Streptomyces roseoverticillatus TaxID=66429 RepID=UPI001F42E791|nr:DUF397 domain-containing protein [Streptomyces roseoverticillatus]MCF3100653.1 DUF397 domain-containing protein [Streptomyces roseoverticillatus]